MLALGAPRAAATDRARAPRSEARVGLIRRAAGGGGGGAPACSLAEALAAANQLIDDMEERMGAPDRRVLG